MDKHSWLPVGWLLFACLFSNTSLLLPLYVELWRAATCAHITTDLSLFHACWAIICRFVELTLLLWVSGPLWSGAIQEVDWCTVHQRGINWLLIWWKGRARCSVGARVFFAVNHVACFRCPGKQLGNWRLRVVGDMNWWARGSKGLQCYLWWALNWKKSSKSIGTNEIFLTLVVIFQLIIFPFQVKWVINWQKNIKLE